MSLDLLVVGADGLDPTTTNYMLEKGYMPTVAELLTDGAEMDVCASRLSGNPVPHTGPAWTTIYTGLTEHEHGITQGGWVQGNVSLERHYEHTVFSDLIEAGYRTGTFTMPITFPAVTDEEDGSWMLSGFPAVADDEDDTRIVAPSEMHDQIEIDYNKIQSELLNPDGERSLSVKKWAAAERYKRQEILPRFTDERPVDVLFYGTQIADTMCHRASYFPPYLDGIARRAAAASNDAFGWALQPPRLGSKVWREEVRQAYRVVDSIIADLIEAHNPDRLLVVSDHGFKRRGGHAYLGTSLVTGDIKRPEYITEVREVVLDALDIEDPRAGREQTEIERSTDDLSDDDREAIEAQMQALGYIGE